MDCNSYSFLRMEGDAVTLACSFRGDYDPVYLEVCRNFFGDIFYFVHEILGDFAEEYPRTTDGYTAAARAYNKLVPATDRIPETAPEA